MDLSQVSATVDLPKDERRAARQRQTKGEAVEVALERQVLLHGIGQCLAVQLYQHGHGSRTLDAGDAVGPVREIGDVAGQVAGKPLGQRRPLPRR